MRVIARTAAALISALAMLALVAGSVVAGGWAEVTVAPDVGEPVAGEDRELRLTVLQHGVAPVDWGNVNLTGTNPETGETIAVDARSVGKGQWIATVTFPTDGTWQLAVTHSDLETSALPALTVGRPVGLAWLPALAVTLAGLAATGIAWAAVRRPARSSAPATVTGVATRAEG